MCLSVRLQWHLGQREQYNPIFHGFDSYLGVPYSVDMGSSALESPLLVDPPLPLLSNTDVLEQPVNFNNLTERYVDHALSFLAAHASGSKNASNPFFLYAAFNHVHVPMFAAPAHEGASLRGHYGDGVYDMDTAIGAIMAAVRQDPVMSTNTLVVFTSDNGYGAGFVFVGCFYLDTYAFMYVNVYVDVYA